VSADSEEASRDAEAVAECAAPRLEDSFWQDKDRAGADVAAVEVA